MNRQQLFELARRGLAALVDLFLQLQAELFQLRRRVKELEGRLALNSSNSSKPPSSDGLAKPAPKSLRSSSGRRCGGQPGHPGRTLQPVRKPDAVVEHPLKVCPCGKCGGLSLRGEPVLGHIKRQVFDLPQKLLEVTEHRAQIKCCPASGLQVHAPFPEDVNAPAQYGPRFKSAMVYLNQEHALPFERLAQISEDLLGQPLSPATIIAANQRTSRNLVPFEERVKQLLPAQPAVHLDESGLRVAGSLHWLHVASTPDLTFYGIHPKRGALAMESFDIIGRCRGWLVHDHLKTYFTYKEALHALCNQHHLRELKFLFEENREIWAGEMSRFLLDWNRRLAPGQSLSETAFKRALQDYHRILARGRRRHPRKSSGAQSKAANLLNRLEDFDLSVLAFLFDPDVPFTNNQAERDIRMVKVRQKVSGCFRTLHGAQTFARIRSYISTCRKQNRNILDNLKAAFQATPFIPSLAQGP